MIALLASAAICISVPGDTECGAPRDVYAAIHVSTRHLCQLSPAGYPDRTKRCRAWVYPQSVVMR
jgi:hypothetical protein